MTRAIFEPFLKKFDREMGLKRRKVILFMDNASCHKLDSSTRFRNVKIIFFPPNCTSQIQPLDLGIIPAFKARYKKRLLQFILSEMEEKAGNAGNLLKSVTVLQSIYWAVSSWEETKAETIQKCFRKAGFLPFVEEPSQENDGSDSGNDAEMAEEAQEEHRTAEEDDDEEEVELFAGLLDLIHLVPESGDISVTEFVNAEDGIPCGPKNENDDAWTNGLLEDFIKK